MMLSPASMTVAVYDCLELYFFEVNTMRATALNGKEYDIARLVGMDFMWTAAFEVRSSLSLSPSLNLFFLIHLIPTSLHCVQQSSIISSFLFLSLSFFLSFFFSAPMSFCSAFLMLSNISTMELQTRWIECSKRKQLATNPLFL